MAEKEKRPRGRPPKDQTKPPAKRGRPFKTIEHVKTRFTDEVLRQIEVMSGLGLTIAQVSAVVGIPEHHMYRDQRLLPELTSALARGRARAEQQVSQSLFQKCLEGDVSAIKWWEATRAGRTENNRHTVEVVNDAVSDARLARIIAERAARLQAGPTGGLPPAPES